MLSKDPFCEWDIGKANRILLFIEKLPFTIFNILPCFSSLVSSLYFKVCLIAAVLKSDPHSRLFRYPAIAEQTQFLFKSNRQIQKKTGQPASVIFDFNNTIAFFPALVSFLEFQTQTLPNLQREQWYI